MKFKQSSFVLIWAILLAGLPLVCNHSLAAVPPDGPSAANAPIPWDQIGAKAGADYHGDGLQVTAQGDRAQLNCVFQRLEGEATPEGLWLTSTVTNQVQDRFRVVATALGRTGTPVNPTGYGGCPSSGALAGETPGKRRETAAIQDAIALTPTGTVTVTDQTVRYERPGLVEEYTVSMDGIRQDFVVLEKPLSRPDGHPLPTGWGEGRGEGAGELRLTLAVSGARVERTAAGVQLVLAESGRKIAYNRLRVTDATGRELPTRMEVTGAATDSAFRTPNSALALAIVVDDTAAAYPIRIDPTFSDANWISMSGLLGASDIVYAAAVNDAGHLYIGGIFTVVGDVVANRIAQWDGSRWHALGAGMNGTVEALAVAGNGDLYAGGAFTTAGGVAATNIARWDGSSWHALGAGVNGTVLALAVAGNGDLYAGGSFTTAGGVTVNRIARWDGSSWSALGTGMNKSVSALAVAGNGELYAGGDFTTAGGVTVNRIARWEGNSWSALGTGMNNWVRALAVAGNGELYAGGDFATAGGVTVNRIARWDGSSWSALGAGMNTTVRALAVAGTNLYAGGNFTTAGDISANYIARWDGNSWHTLGSGMNSSVYALAVAGNGDLYAGGSFSKAGGETAHRIARWDGSSWSALGAGMNATVRALAVAGNGDLYAGGDFTTAGDVSANYIARWDGSRWHALGSGMGGDTRPYVYALAVAGNGDLYAGGAFTTAGGVTAIRIARWDGSRWHALGSGMEGGISPTVYALAVAGNGDLYAGGWFTTAGGVTVNRIARWDGSSWSALGSGMNQTVSALAVAGNGDLYAGGGFTTAGGKTVNQIARWDGSSWHALGAGMNNQVYALAVAGNGGLYAGGNFTTAGGVAANYIARWDGSSWQALGSGMGGVSLPGVYELAVTGNGDLYAGGEFTTAGGETANYIARWDGSSWSALGSGMNGRVSALIVAGNDNLYVGGNFTKAGDKISYHLARAVLSSPLTPIPLQWQVQNQQLVLSWTNAGFQLQAAPEASGTYTNVPNATSPYTTPLTGSRRFFRLHAP